MDRSAWDEKAVFLKALGLPEDQREAFLAGACPGEPEKDRIHTLLRHHEQADEFLTIAAGKPTDTALPQQIDEFKIIHRLGEGGMGVVYLAEDTVLGRRVALKVLAGHLTGSEQALARFREEARNAAALKHPAIVPVFRFGRDGQNNYLVTEFVDGPTLASVIAEKRQSFKSLGTQDVREWHRRTAEIIAVIADALDCAHRAKIVHRDVKPSNILMDRERGPRLADFGIAKHLVEENRTQTTLVGSCHYMSPEQASIAGKHVDQRSDIFSLGVVLYEMLSLRLPFDGANMHQVLRAVAECSPPRLRTIDRRIPADLETICHKAIEKLPQDRYPTAAHVAADLRCYLVGDSILAHPPGVMRRARRWVRHNRRRVNAALLMFLISCIGLLGYSLQRKSQSGQTTVSFDSNRRDASLLIRPMPSSRVPFEPARALGHSPVRDLKLNSGVYELSAIAPDGEFCDAIIFVPPAAAIDSSASNPRFTVNIPRDSGSMLADMVHIPAGVLRHAELPDLPVSSFWIDKREVSNAEYRKFLVATGHSSPYHWSGEAPELKYDESLADYPIVGITMADAAAFAHWLGKRLPTEWEWEYAMSRPDNRDVPWDGAPELTKVAPEDAALAGKPEWRDLLRLYRTYCRPVDSQEEFGTPTGILHGNSNVTEITASIDMRGGILGIGRGASWLNMASGLTLRDQSEFPWSSVSTRRGFRCVRSFKPILSPQS